MPQSMVWPRLVAFGVDVLLILIYIAMVVPGLVYGASWPWPDAPWRTQLVGLGTITLPVIGYFACTEASTRGATLGKRALALRVVTLQGARLPLRRSLTRNVLRFAPWELAHTVSYRLAVSATAEPWHLGIAILALGWAMYYLASLLTGAHRPAYDRAVGAAVTSRDIPGSWV